MHKQHPSRRQICPQAILRFYWTCHGYHQCTAFIFQYHQKQENTHNNLDILSQNFPAGVRLEPAERPLSTAPPKKNEQK